MGDVRTIAINLFANDHISKVLDGINKKTEKSSGHFGKLKAAATGLAIAGSAALGKFAKDSISAASDLNESMSKTQTVFGNSSAAVVAFSKTTATSLGISQQQALEAAGTFGNLFVAMKIGTKTSADMSTRLVTLAADLASFNNTSPKDALEALRSGLTGEIEPLRRYGVNLTAAGVQAEAFRLGLVKTTKDSSKITVAQERVNIATANYAKVVKEHGKGSLEAQRASVQLQVSQNGLEKAVKGTVPQLTAAQKAQAAYSLILQQTKVAQGDSVRTGDQLANSQRRLSAEFDDLKAKAGKALLPAFLGIVHVLSKQVVPALSKVVGWMTQHKTIVLTLAAAIGGLIVVTKTWQATMAAVTAITGIVNAVKALNVQLIAQKVALVAVNVWMGIVKVATIAWTAVQWLLNVALDANPIGLIILAIAALVVGIIEAYKHSETFRKVVAAAWAGIQVAAQAAWETTIRPIFNLIKAYITNILIPGYKTLWSVIKTVWGGISSAFRTGWNFVKSVFNGIKSAISSVVGAFRSAVSKIKSVWGSLTAALRRPIDAFLNAWNSIQGIWGSVKASVPGLPHFANGGILPGFSPGNDSIMAMLSPGEAVLRPEAVRALGAGFINRLNSGAASGTLGGAGSMSLVRPSAGVSAMPMASAATGTAPVVLKIESGGSRFDDALVEVLRKSIRVRGGNVQVVLGR